MPKFEYKTLEELQQEVRKGKLNEDLLDWEYSAKISEWLANLHDQAGHAAELHEAYRKTNNNKKQLKAILTALSLSEHEIESLLREVPIEAAQQTPLTLEELNKQMNTINQQTKYLDSFKAVIGTISLLPAENISTSSGWILCEGQRLPTKYYEVLFTRLGKAHGGDGESCFAIPDLRTYNLCENYKYYIFTGVFNDIPKDAFANIKDPFSVNGIYINMILVEGGTFMMGNVNGDFDEQPVHSVTLSSYYISKFPVTQALWKAVMNDNNPSSFRGDNLPVESVSYIDCQDFLKKLNTITGKEYRLPTEAEWEFAARGGRHSCNYTYSGSDSLSEVGWYDDNSSGTSHPIGEKKQNELGIYDMSGNVWEWCSDWKDSYNNRPPQNPTGQRVIRGGCWDYHSVSSRVTYRDSDNPNNSGNGLGFRLALSCPT